MLQEIFYIFHLHVYFVRLQRELVSRKKSRQRKDKTRNYQRTLNKSIDSMSRLFDDFNKEGWEDLTDR